MRWHHITPRVGITVLALAPLLALIGMAGRVAAYSPGCGKVRIVYGLPQWGFHTGSPEGGSFARGHGQINLQTNTVSGIICQEDPAGAITMTVEHGLGHHSHHAEMWGFPGNIMRIRVLVRASDDPNCKIGTVGHAVLFASYNGVRSDSVNIFFPAACQDQDHLYHGSRVISRVPPL
jgi:hypothetical protein